MRPLYPRPGARGFGNAGSAKGLAKPLAKPLKRPSQARAKFTVQAIYDAFVRICRREGWAGISTRAVALESGVAVGTLYDYFPNKEALLSGYVRHCVDSLLQAVDELALQPPALSWRERVRCLVRLCCGVHETRAMPLFDAGMLALESLVAEPKHHRRAFDELSALWRRVLAACTDLPAPPSDALADSLFACVWGGRRYLLLVDSGRLDMERWAAELEHICCATLSGGV